MYLTRMPLDMTRRDAMLALQAPHRLHGAIEAACEGMEKRKLWRIDRLGEQYFLLLLSAQKPNLQAASAQFGAEGDWETRDYEPLLARTKKGSVWRFRLVANPTESVPSSQNQRGKVRACSIIEDQMRWLRRRAEKNGFLLAEDGFAVTENRWQTFDKHYDATKHVSLLAVTYEGLLTVTDEALFRQALTDGMGRGKAYGMGLLTVMRVQGA